MKNKLVFIIFVLAFSFRVTVIFAHDYVLPYPSYMPGNKLYKISRILDRLQNYWYWGNLAKVRYHMNMSDKYLVEAKVLFEYNQYLLGVDALGRSNSEYQQIRTYLNSARGEGKDIREISTTFTAEEEKHEEILEVMKEHSPGTFLWTPEKVMSTNLPLHELIDSATEIRKKEIVGL